MPKLLRVLILILGAANIVSAVAEMKSRAAEDGAAPVTVLHPYIHTDASCELPWAICQKTA